MDVIIKSAFDCKVAQNMSTALGNQFGAYEVCQCKPSENMFHQYAAECVAGYASNLTIAGIA